MTTETTKDKPLGRIAAEIVSLVDELTPEQRRKVFGHVEDLIAYMEVEHA